MRIHLEKTFTTGKTVAFLLVTFTILTKFLLIRKLPTKLVHLTTENCVVQVTCRDSKQLPSLETKPMPSFTAERFSPMQISL